MIHPLPPPSRQPDTAQEAMACAFGHMKHAQRLLANIRDLTKRARLFETEPLHAKDQKEEGPRFRAVEELIAKAELIASGDSDRTRRLLDEVMRAVRSNMHSAVLMGILMQGILTSMESLDAMSRWQVSTLLSGFLLDKLDRPENGGTDRGELCGKAPPH